MMPYHRDVVSPLHRSHHRCLNATTSPPRETPPPTLDSSAVASFVAKDGQLLLPMLDLIENAQCAIDDLIDVMGRATIEAVLRMSAAGLVGPKQQGKKSDRGAEKGRVAPGITPWSSHRSGRAR